MTTSIIAILNVMNIRINVQGVRLIVRVDMLKIFSKLFYLLNIDSESSNLTKILILGLVALLCH